MYVNTIRRLSTKVIVWMIVLAQIAFFPLPISAQSDGGNGARWPTGAAAHTFVYNQETGLYENQYYTYNPSTATYTPRYDDSYKYNDATGLLEADYWYYSPAKGAYVHTLNTKVPPEPVAQPAQQTEPQAQATATTSDTGPNSNASTSGGSGTDANISNTGANSDNTITSDNDNLDANIDNTGPDSSNSINSSNDSSATVNNDFDATLTHNIDSNATSGNASVLQNTNAGNALTGDATSMATIINLLQSSYGMSQSEIATFIANIDGDVYGDLMVDPGQLPKRNLSAGVAPTYDNLTINSSLDGQINNNVNLDATSGDATVSRNTNAGNATSGDATAIANIINMMNSAIAAGQSFVGTININGNLEGDILLPDWMRNQLLATGLVGGSGQNSANVTNTGPGSTNTVDINDDSSYVGNFDDNIAINNNISSNANSGAATVSQNTNAGNATSGDAVSNVNILNLTGKQVIGANSLLVFVNVLGEWLGVIMDAPAGVTSAQIGGGITQNQQLPARNTEINSTNNMEINNNVNVNATSGDAIVSQNTNAGNATSGDARTGVNIANIANSQMSFSDWFGVLFINVFGAWTGSFGVDTEAGGLASGGSGAGGPAPPVANSTGGTQNTATTGGQQLGQVFSFIPRAINSSDSGNSQDNQVAAAASTQTGNTPTSGQAQATEAEATASQVNTSTAASANRTAPVWLTPLIVTTLVGAAIVIADRRWRFIPS